jgi:hypothetical protein
MPVGTTAKALFRIKAGSCGEGGWLAESKASGALFVNAEITVLEGPYAKRKFYSMFGVKAGMGNLEGTELWAKKGRSQLRALIESARNIHPKDASEAANNARSIKSYGDLQNLTCAVKIGVEEDKSGFYKPRNKVLEFITPDHKDYGALMNRAPAAIGDKPTVDAAPPVPTWDPY